MATRRRPAAILLVLVALAPAAWTGVVALHVAFEHAGEEGHHLPGVGMRGDEGAVLAAPGTHRHAPVGFATTSSRPRPHRAPQAAEDGLATSPPTPAPSLPRLAPARLPEARTSGPPLLALLAVLRI